MRIIAIRTLKEFWEAYPDSEQPLRAWYSEAKRAEWKTPAEIKSTYSSASIIPDNRVVFDIKGNDYRLVVRVEYRKGLIFIRFIGTHGQYDEIDVATI